MTSGFIIIIIIINVVIIITSTNTIITIIVQLSACCLTDPEMIFYCFGLETIFPSFWKTKTKKEHSQYIFQPDCFFFSHKKKKYVSPLVLYIQSEQAIKKHKLTTPDPLSPLPTPTRSNHQDVGGPQLRHDSKHGVVATDARANLLIVLFGVAYLVELRS